ncbi:Transketolase [Fusarium solani]
MTRDGIDQLTVNTIRLLAVDATFRSNSGHPGAPMGMAPMAHVLFSRFLTFSPQNPEWLNRDRFVLSNGHGCMLQYALLHLYGYDVSMDDLKDFRKLGSKTPGHPEAKHTPGVEVTTGPLGQGVANAVGLAMAQAHTAAVFNKPGYTLIDNFTYCFLGDGCLMEGVASEASSLAGHLQLGNLICVYDDNHISIDGDIDCTFTEDVVKRYESYGWHVLTVDDGDGDLEAIAAAFKAARQVKDKPSLIKVRTTIGYGSLSQGTHGVHGNPLKEEDIRQVKLNFGFDPKETFVVRKEVYDLCKRQSERGAKLESDWHALLEKYATEYPAEYADLSRRLAGDLPKDWEKHLPTFCPSAPAVATRKISELILGKLESVIPELFGGSADLTPSNLTRWNGAVDFQASKSGDYSGRYVRYGVREHAMGAIMNGLAAYGTVLPYAGTFLNFVSYAAGAVRLSALSRFRTIWIATHDSIGLGEDGPTHQPIETLSHFRALPNLMVWRPADGNETSAAYRMALESRSTPSILALCRQNLPHLEESSIRNACKGGYTLKEVDGAHITIVSSGSEVSLYAHQQFGLDRFGASGPANEVFEKFGFTPEGIAERAASTVEFYRSVVDLRSPLRLAF